MMIMRQLSGSYLKLEAEDRITILRKALSHSMESLAIAQSLGDQHMVADLTGKVGSCTFELGIEMDSVNLIHEALSYHLEAALAYSKWSSYWQQQSMHYGYAAYCIECLPDADAIPNAKRRVDIYKKLLKCLPAEVPESYVNDISERLSEAESILNEE